VYVLNRNNTGIVSGGIVNIQNLILDMSGSKVISSNTELVVQQFTLVPGAVTLFDLTSTGKVRFQGNLTLSGV
jgi:hypothetical protein